MADLEPNVAPLIKHFTERFEHPLYMIETLQNIKVIERKIRFPKILVLGDKSAGKSTLISNLIGLNYPGDLKVPLIFKFELHSNPCRKLYLEYETHQGVFVNDEILEDEVGCKLLEAAKQLPESKASNVSITVIVKQQHASDLEIVDLPGIRVYSDKDQQKKELEVMEGYLLEHTTRQCLLLNVVSALADFNSCLSKVVIQNFRLWCHVYTVRVFTKLDLCSEDMITQLTLNNIDSHCGLGYLYVKRYEKGEGETQEESDKFSKIDKKYFGFDAVAHNLVIGMLSILFDRWSLILDKIDTDLENSTTEIKLLEKEFNSIGDAVLTILDIVSFTRSSLDKLFIAGEYSKYRNEKNMHSATVLAKELERFYSNLQQLKIDERSNFLDDEIQLLELRNWLYSVNVLSSGIIKPVLKKQISYASSTIDTFIRHIFDYIHWVVMRVLLDNAKHYQQLHSPLKEVARNMILEIQKSFMKKVEEMLDLEKMFLHTCNPEFVSKYNKMKLVRLRVSDLEKNVVHIEGLGEVAVGHLKSYPEDKWQSAFDLKMLMVAYWEFVVNRFVDYFALNLMSSIEEMVRVGFGERMIKHFCKFLHDESKLPDVEPKTYIYRTNLETRIEYLIKVKKDIEKLQRDFEFLL